LYQSELLSTYAERVIHGFTGKPITLGGPSHPPDTIRGNRLALCRHAGLSEHRLTLPRQTHTNCYRINDFPCESDTDAVILTETGIPAMVQVADCVPVILYEPQRHIGAVVHAGWRGTAQAITQKVAQCLIQEHHAAPEHLIAVIGPSIGGCCYEVSQEVADSVAASIPQTSLESWQQPHATSGKPYIDLKQVNRLQLQALGVQHIERIDVCTRCEEERLWSYRRGENGRQVAFLELLPASSGSRL
jgi:YfiH family protein